MLPDKIRGKQIEDKSIEQYHLELEHPGFFEDNAAATVKFVKDLYLSGITTGITSGSSGSSDRVGRSSNGYAG
jgi:hypothetical protein